MVGDANQLQTIQTNKNNFMLKKREKNNKTSSKNN